MSIYVPTANPAERARRRSEDVLYGRERGETVVWTRGAVTSYWVNELRERVRADQDAVVLVWGAAGSGKSTCVLDLARRIDPSFNAESLPERVAFRAEHVPTLYERTPRYGVAFIDEAVSSGLMATDHFTREQKELVELVNIIRARNVVLFVNIPDPSDLAKSFRARRADYRIEVIKEYMDEPPVAHVGRRVRYRKFNLDDGRWLGFSDDPDANPLRWDEYRTSVVPAERSLWDAYYPLKMRYLDEAQSRISRSMLARLKKREESDDG